MLISSSEPDPNPNRHMVPVRGAGPAAAVRVVNLRRSEGEDRVTHIETEHERPPVELERAADAEGGHASGTFVAHLEVMAGESHQAGTSMNEGAGAAASEPGAAPCEHQGVPEITGRVFGKPLEVEVNRQVRRYPAADAEPESASGLSEHGQTQPCELCPHLPLLSD